MNRWSTGLSRAVRSLSRAPGFTAVTVVTLGLAIGAIASIFSVVKGVLLEPLSFHEPDRLVTILSSTPGNATPPEYQVSPEFYVHYGRDVPGLAQVAIFNQAGGTARVADRAERIDMALVSVSFFETLGVELAAGRLPTRDDVDPTPSGNAVSEVALISHRLWARAYSSDPGVVGHSIELNSLPRTIIGVLPEGMELPNARTDIWLPFEIDADNVQPGQFGWAMVGRLTDDTSLAALEPQLAAVAGRLPEIFAGAAQYRAFMVDGQYRPVVKPLKEEMIGEVRQPLLVLLGTAALVLLIACANVANLFLVRAESKQREMAVRSAMGAQRSSLVSAHMTEAVVLAALGGTLGAVVASVGVPLMARAAPEGIPRLDRAGLDYGVLWFTAAVSLFSALLFGLVAAVRYSGPRLLAQLRSAGRGAIGGRDRQLARNALVISQSALALVLLVGSGLLVRSFAELMDIDPGFDRDNVLSFQIALPADRYETPAAMATFHQTLIDRLAGLPGVEAVGAIRELMLDERSQGTAFEFENSGIPADERQPLLTFNYASPGFFESMGIQVLAGRAFRPADSGPDLGNVVVSRSVAERHWPNQDPIGKRLRQAGDSTGWEVVVGVVEDVRDRDLREEPTGMVYLPFVSRRGDTGWRVPSPVFTIRAENPLQLAGAARDEVARLDPDLPVYAMQTMEAVVSDSVVRLSFTMLALGVAALMAIVLGAVGLYGVLSYLVAQRTQEIGVRMALGAEMGQVRGMVVRQGARLALVGMVVGLLVSAAMTRVLQGLLYGTEALDPLVFSSMALLMLLVGVLASYLPARRASLVSPVESMRGE